VDHGEPRLAGGFRIQRRGRRSRAAQQPFALERLRVERHREGAEERTATASHGEAGIHQVIYLPARPTRAGRTVLALSPLELPSATFATLRLLAALSRLIPPPRVHRHRYHGVLAPNARLREQVIHLGRDNAATPADTLSLAGSEPHDASTARDADAADLPDSPQRAAARSRWARLLARIYEVFPLTCPDCGTDMRILAFVTAAEPRRRKKFERGSRIQPGVAERHTLLSDQTRLLMSDLMPSHVCLPGLHLQTTSRPIA
jgi:hypothetical protein